MTRETSENFYFLTAMDKESSSITYERYFLEFLDERLDILFFGTCSDYLKVLKLLN